MFKAPLDSSFAVQIQKVIILFMLALNKYSVHIIYNYYTDGILAKTDIMLVAGSKRSNLL